MKANGNTILITGGGSGIGRELARRFQALGDTVIVAGRGGAALKETIGDRERMAAATLDIADASAVDRFAKEIVTAHPTLNAVVHCAGIMRLENRSDGGSSNDAAEMIATNLCGAIRLNQALIPHLIGQPDAAIVTVSSGLGFVPLAAAPTYSATKAAVHAYTLAMREQLKGQIEVIELVPPAVQTELTPGQSNRAGYLPLGAFIDEVMALFAEQPTPAEIIVERAAFFRHAEREGRFDAAFATLNAIR
jgi:uncharacterized oxidoreductase